MSSFDKFNFKDNLSISKANSSSQQIGIFIIFWFFISSSSEILISSIFFKSSKLIKLRSNDIISLLYDGIRLLIPLFFFFFILLKYLITLHYPDLSHHQNYNRVMRHQDLIYF